MPQVLCCQYQGERLVTAGNRFAGTENPRVGGSIPSLGTIPRRKFQGLGRLPRSPHRVVAISTDVVLPLLAGSTMGEGTNGS